MSFAGALLETYRGVGRLAEPALPLLLERRARAGKEDRDRLPERLGHASRPRPPGRLVWLHAASVGESLSLLPLLEAWREAAPKHTLLLTTGTVTSARLLASRLPEAVIHQFFPLDAPGPVGRFLGHWRPDLAVFCESELWPGWLRSLATRGIPTALVNARMSERSFGRWRRMPALAAALIGGFTRVLAQSEADAERLAALGAKPVEMPGNLKDAAAPLPCDPAALAALRDAVGERPVWLTASTHPGEEALVAAAHDAIAGSVGNLLTVIVPRHPERGAEVETVARASHRTVTRRSVGGGIAAEVAIHVADTLGELGLFYRAATLALVGGSLVRHGGQNPLEPARLGCPIVIGPHSWNFAVPVARLRAAGGIVEIADGADLAATVRDLLADPARRAALATGARAALRENDAVVRRTLDALLPLVGPRAERA